MKVHYQDILDAEARIRSMVKRTQVDESRSASEQLGAKVYLKLENEQVTGSFKIRGALNKIKQLSDSERKAGVIACSAGNHAQGVALSATLANVPSTIVMPKTAPLVKVSATKGYGAEVILFGQTFDEAFQHAMSLKEQKGYTFVHPFEDEQVIAGQGTLGLELNQQVPAVDTVIVPIGGGGLISGIATAVKHLNPSVRIIGVQSEQTPGMHDLFHFGKKRERFGPIRTIADGIAVKIPSEKMHQFFIKPLVDEIVTVTDFEIAQAMVFLLERVKTVAEASGAAGLAAALAGKIQLGASNVFVICGGNVDLNLISRVIEKGLQQKGRIARLSVIAPDIPGQLNHLTQIFAESGANVLDVHHNRLSTGVFLRETKIEFVIETTGFEHLESIKANVTQSGFKLVEEGA